MSVTLDSLGKYKCVLFNEAQADAESLRAAAVNNNNVCLFIEITKTIWKHKRVIVGKSF